MKQIYLIRHGQTDWNAQMRLQGQTDIPLNQVGISQAKKLALSLKEKHIDHVVSSDLTRASHTAEILNESWRKTHDKETMLREINLGSVEGLTREDAYKILGNDFWSNWSSGNPLHLSLQYPDGESKKEGIHRLTQVILKFSQKHKNIALVSHGLLIRSFVSFHFPHFAPDIQFPNASATIIGITPEGEFKFLEQIKIE